MFHIQCFELHICIVIKGFGALAWHLLLLSSTLTHTHTQTHTQAHAHTHVHSHMHIHIYVTYTCTYAHTHTYTHTHAHMHTHIHAHMPCAMVSGVGGQLGGYRLLYLVLWYYGFRGGRPVGWVVVLYLVL